MKDKAGRYIKAIKRKKGQALVEYVLLAGFVALTAVIALAALGKNVFKYFSDLVEKFSALNIVK